MRISAFIALTLVLFSPLSASAAGQVVSIKEGYNLEPGSILVRASERALYFILDRDTALRFPVAVPKRGKEWSGYARVEGKFLAPAWSPPAEVRADHPELPEVIPGGAKNNPMGAAAITLDRSEIAIHGVAKSMEKSIGTAASYGCVRMRNADIAELFSHVEVGATVLMVK